MNKTYQTELRRLFLIADLPEPLTRASQHLQIFDNYIENTRLRLRYVRVPHAREHSFHLEHRFPADENNPAVWKIAEIFLNDDEHRVFEQFEGREIRKNRYFYDYEGKQVEIDVFLGELWGLNILKAVFETEDEMNHFDVPIFAILEITHFPFFAGENLVGKNFADVQKEFERINATHQRIIEVPDE